MFHSPPSLHNQIQTGSFFARYQQEIEHAKDMIPLPKSPRLLSVARDLALPVSAEDLQTFASLLESEMAICAYFH
jgi:hypothetical protein